MIALVTIAAFALGTLIASRLCRRQRRTLQRELAQRELALLDLKSDQARLQRGVRVAGRREALLSLVLRKLSDAETRVRKVESILDAQERQHDTNCARLHGEVVRARSQAREAATLARRATSNLKRFDAASASPEAISARGPKSYGSGDEHAVSVADQGTHAVRCDAIGAVSNLESARLNRLRSNNESSGSRPCVSLQSIDGITPADERRLNDAGIHRVEQLANLSDHDADALDRVMKLGSHSPAVDWPGVARRVLDQTTEPQGA